MNTEQISKQISKLVESSDSEKVQDYDDGYYTGDSGLPKIIIADDSKLNLEIIKNQLGGLNLQHHCEYFTTGE